MKAMKPRAAIGEQTAQSRIRAAGGAILFVSRSSSPELHGGGKIRRDLLEAARRAGFEQVLVPGSRGRYFTALVRLRFPRGSVIVLPYPGIPSIRKGSVRGFASLGEAVLLILKKWSRRLRLFLYVYDLPIEQQEAFGGFPPHLSTRMTEALLFRAADVIGVMGSEMERVIRQRHTLLSGHFVHYGFLPYYAPCMPKSSTPGHSRRVAFVGNLSRRRIDSLVKTLPQEQGIEYCFYGPDGDWLEEIREDFRWYGAFNTDELSLVLNETADFGLVLYDTANVAQLRYMHMATTSKFFAYVYAGLPILSYSYRHIAQVIQTYGLGYVFDDPIRLVSIVLGIDEDRYRATAQRVAQFAYELASRNTLAEFVETGLALVNQSTPR